MKKNLNYYIHHQFNFVQEVKKIDQIIKRLKTTVLTSFHQF